jgi:two-component system, NarL family, sensor kinase
VINDNEVIFTFIIGTVLLTVFVIFIIIFIILYQRRQLQNLQEKAALKAAYEKAILQSQIEVQNQTLQQIGQELHDNIGQILSVARLNLNLLEEESSTGVSQEYARNTNELVGKAIADLRSLAKSLDGDFVKDFGLEQSLMQELQRIKKTGKFQTELEVTGSRFELGFQTEIVLYRICQEILNNAIKHSGANLLKITLNYEFKILHLCVADNGRGFDYEQVISNSMSESGAGLRNIKRRAELLGGSCGFLSKLGEGTQITINSPIGG